MRNENLINNATQWCERIFNEVRNGIQSFITSSGMTLEALAESLDIDVTELYNIYNGVVEPSINTVAKLLLASNLSLEIVPMGAPMGGGMPPMGMQPMNGGMPPMGAGMPPMGRPRASKKPMRAGMPPMGAPMGGGMPPMGMQPMNGGMPPMGAGMPPMGRPRAIRRPMGAPMGGGMPPMGMQPMNGGMPPMGVGMPSMGAPMNGEIPPMGRPMGAPMGAPMNGGMPPMGAPMGRPMGAPMNGGMSPMGMPPMGGAMPPMGANMPPMGAPVAVPKVGEQDDALAHLTREELINRARTLSEGDVNFSAFTKQGLIDFIHQNEGNDVATAMGQMVDDMVVANPHLADAVH